MPSVEELEESHADGDEADRVKVFQNFGHYGRSRKTSALLAKGLRDPAPAVRAWAALALHEWDPGDPSAARDLGWGLEHADYSWRFAEALVKLGPKAAPAVGALARRSQRGDMVAARCAEALFRIEGPSPRVIEALRRVLHGPDAWHATQVVKTIGRPAEPLADDLRKLFPRTSYMDMFGASDALTAVLGSPRASIDLYLAGLDHENATIRNNCAWGLARIGPAATLAVPRLLERVDDPPERVRATVAYALSEVAPASPDVRNALQAMLNDPSELVREWVRDACETVDGVATPD